MTSHDKNSSTGLLHLIHACREPIDGDKEPVRLVHRSEIARTGDSYSLDQYVADRAPLFYRSIESIVADLRAGYFKTAVDSTLARLPTSTSFVESHFGEVVAAIFAEDVLGLRRIYSKLTLLTSENSNPYKMDLLLFDPSTEPVTLIFGEVKSSPKDYAHHGDTPRHDTSCFPDLFSSMRKYSESDVAYDLTAARDNLYQLPAAEQERVRAALLPYSGAPIRYIGFALIDWSTFNSSEAQLLRTRRSSTEFSVDLVCLESYAEVAHSAYDSIYTPRA